MSIWPPKGDIVSLTSRKESVSASGVQFALVRLWASSAQQKASEAFIETKMVGSPTAPLLLFYFSTLTRNYVGSIACGIGIQMKKTSFFFFFFSMLFIVVLAASDSIETVVLCLSYTACPTGACGVDEVIVWRVDERVCVWGGYVGICMCTVTYVHLCHVFLCMLFQVFSMCMCVCVCFLRVCVCQIL